TGVQSTQPERYWWDTSGFYPLPIDLLFYIGIIFTIYNIFNKRGNRLELDSLNYKLYKDDLIFNLPIQENKNKIKNIILNQYGDRILIETLEKELFLFNINNISQSFKKINDNIDKYKISFHKHNIVLKSHYYNNILLYNDNGNFLSKITFSDSYMIKFNHRGDILVIAHNNHIDLFNLEGKLINTFIHNDEYPNIYFSKNDEYILIVNQYIYIFTINELIISLNENNIIDKIKINKLNNRFIVFEETYKYAKLFDFKGNSIQTFQNINDFILVNIKFNRIGDKFIVYDNNSITEYDLNGNKLHSFNHKCMLLDLITFRFKPDNTFLIISLGDIKIFKKFKLTSIISIHDESKLLYFDKDSIILYNSTNKKIKIFKCLRNLSLEQILFLRFLCISFLIKKKMDIDLEELKEIESTFPADFRKFLHQHYPQIIRY
ncbi:MAG: hypothetical protein QW303_05890, partial [Nitrososphaerota archaeon]